MLPQEIIKKKRDGKCLTPSEMEGFVGGYLAGEVTDYQMSALLMAIYFQGLSRDEVVRLTDLAKRSGVVFDWGGDQSQVVDKHSTGGVGDKASLIILPLALLEGLRVPMIAGRGLGHTGGTVDKLESIPGMRLDLTPAECHAQMEKLGGFLLGQTEDIAPLDQRTYRLRDVTATVESIPLIVVSILSKKLAEGIGGLVMDVKFGSGAFMQDYEDALELATYLKDVSEAGGVRFRGVLSSMNGPLGECAGNALEIWECLQIMSGAGPKDTTELSVELTAQMVELAKPEEDPQRIRERLRGHLSSGRCFEKFAEIVEAQGGDRRLLETPERFRTAPTTKPALVGSALGDGQFAVASVDVRALGLAVVSLGGGRRRSQDSIDHRVGLSDLLRPGDLVPEGGALAQVHAASETAASEAARLVRSAYVVLPKEEAPDALPLIRNVLI